MELIKDYDFTLHYHPGKANHVADALSRKRRTKSLVARTRCALYTMLGELSEFTFYRESTGLSVFLGTMAVEESLKDRIVRAQREDAWVQDWVTNLSKYTPEMSIGSDGGLRLNGRLVVSKVPELKLEICDEAHKTRYIVHPGGTKMYKDLKRNFW